jgi:hypothetical protein
MQLSGSRAWHTWDFEAVQLAATHLPDGAPVLFASDADHRVWHVFKRTPALPWSEWEPLDGPATTLAAAVIPHGGLTVFGARDGVVHHRWQDEPYGRWSKWTSLERPPSGAVALGAGTIAGGGLVIFALGTDGTLAHRWQDKPFSRWHDWEPVGDGVRHFSLTRAPGGGLAVFAIGPGEGVRYRFQSKPFGDWSRWKPLSSSAQGIAAQPSWTDGLEVFAIGRDDEVYHTWCERIDWPWSQWTLLEREPLARAPVG